MCFGQGLDDGFELVLFCFPKRLTAKFDHLDANANMSDELTLTMFGSHAIGDSRGQR